MTPPITECDLQSYVDDQLDAAGRLEVADFLVRHPDVAARVLADLRVRDALRALSNAEACAMSTSIHEDARRLDAALKRRMVFSKFVRATPFAAAMAIAIIAVGAFQYSEFSTTARAAVPEFVEEALMSQQTAQLRARMPSQPETAHFDAGAVRRATRIDIPDLPPDWRVLDAQLFPSDFGPSLQMVIDTGSEEQVSLFAVRTSADLPEDPELKVVDGQAIGYWSREGNAYLLTGDEPAERIAEHAEDLAASADKEI